MDFYFEDDLGGLGLFLSLTVSEVEKGMQIALLLLFPRRK